MNVRETETILIVYYGQTLYFHTNFVFFLGFVFVVFVIFSITLLYIKFIEYRTLRKNPFDIIEHLGLVVKHAGWDPAE